MSLDLSTTISLESASSDRWLSLVPELVRELAAQDSLPLAREVLMAFTDAREQAFRAEDPDARSAVELYLILQCCRVLKTVCSRRGEMLAGVSTVEVLWRAAQRNVAALDPMPSEGFWAEIYHLFLGVIGEPPVYKDMGEPEFVDLKGREAALVRSADLEVQGREVQAWVNRYPDGLSPEAIERRDRNRDRILGALGGASEHWGDWKWHTANIIRDAETLGRLVELTDKEVAAITRAKADRLPFGITPYYASLMDQVPDRRWDHAVRAQVIPSLDYVERVADAGDQADSGDPAGAAEQMDYMGEMDTSPVDLVTRRYPQIAVLKPFNTCAQICVYCQRNWEVDDAMCPTAMASREQIDRAIRWIADNPGLQEILITGGDPLLMSDETLDWILGELALIPHIERIRLGSRVPVVLPMRITPGLLEIFRRYHRQADMSLCLVTHVEHPYEVTPDMQRAVGEVRRIGMAVYNQQVFTIENSRKFESVALRYALKRVGIDPYYCFNTKGKEETRFFRVPVSRILQERKEEARLIPGTVRTDEPVFNVPRLGKNHLRAGQDRFLIGFERDGGRIYEFLPWEKNLSPTPSYVYTDVPIHEYLGRLAKRGEDPVDYRNIWYYF